MKSFTLYELNAQIKNVLKQGLQGTFWVTAEITEIQLNRSGHCYLQLADKREDNDQIIATARATIWAFVFQTLRPYFETTTGQQLAKGMRVMLNVEVIFHELYGLSLNVKDIDPVYTLGDLERRRLEILKRLENEGMIDMNKRLEFPILPKNIAVISSPTAAGLGDFMNQLENNIYGYSFHVKLFPAIMQGDKTVESVIAALDRIYEYDGLFDVVVLIRGGGSQTDLACFDSYDLAVNIAQFPLPVIAGIGHERDETIADRVAYMRVKTPTAAAVFLIDTFHKQEEYLDTLYDRFLTATGDILDDEKKRHLIILNDFRRIVSDSLLHNEVRLKLLSGQLTSLAKNYIGNCQGKVARMALQTESKAVMMIDKNRNRLEIFEKECRHKAMETLARQDKRLELAAAVAKYVNPQNVLERGYSITRLNGKAVKTPELLKEGDVLETELVGGTVTTRVMDWRKKVNETTNNGK